MPTLTLLVGESVHGDWAVPFASGMVKLIRLAHERLPGHQIDDPVAVERSSLDREVLERPPGPPCGLRFARVFGAHQDMGRIIEQNPADDFAVVIHRAPLVTRIAVAWCNGCAS